MRAMWFIAMKDLALLRRDWAGLFFAFGFPLLIAVFFGVIFSAPGESRRGVELAVIDLDGSPASTALIETLGDAAELHVRTADDGQGAELVRTSKAAAALVIEAGFGAAHARAGVGTPMRLRLMVDPAHEAEGGIVRGAVSRAVFADVGARFGPGDAGGGSGLPLVIEQEQVVAEGRSPFLVTFPQGLVWGTLACASAFGISLVTERRQGTLVRLRVGPVRLWQVLAGKGLACFLSILAMSGTVVLVGAIGFGVMGGASRLGVVAVMVSVAAGFVGIMMLLAVLGKTEASAGGIGWAVLLVLAMVGGAMVPASLMPEWLGPIAEMSPVRWAIVAYEGAMWRGWSHAALAVPCVKLVAVGSACFAVGAWVFARGARASL